MLRTAPAAPGPDPTVVEGTMLQRAVRHAHSLGADVAAILARVGLTEAQIHQPGALFSLAQSIAVYADLARQTNDVCLGITLALTHDETHYGLLGLLFKHQQTLDAAYDSVARYYSAFLSGAELKVLRESITTLGDDGQAVTQQRTRVVSRFTYEHPGLDYLRQETLTAVYRNARRVGLASNPQSVAAWVPLAVTFRQTAPPDPSPFVEAFGILPQFSKEEDTFVLDPSVLQAHNDQADQVLLGHLLEAAEEHLARRRRAAGDQRSHVLLLRGCSVDLDSGLVHTGGKVSTLTAKERELLNYLAAHKNQVVTHAAIEGDVWGIGKTVISHAPAVAIRRLRQKIEPGTDPVNLVTVFGEGWKLVVQEPESV